MESTTPPSLSSLAEKVAALPKRHTNEDPLWAGPSGGGELGGITQSMINKFLSCRERFRLKYILGLELPDRWNHKIGYGNMWHVCEESHAAEQVGGPARIKTWAEALNDHTKQQLQRYPLQREELLKWYQTCMTQFPEYVNRWRDHPDVRNRTPLLQEQVFDVPYKLPSGRTVRLRGKWDSVDLIQGGACECGADRTGPSAEAHSEGCPAIYTTGIYLQENKTKGQVDELRIERQLRFDLQTMLYLVALKLWWEGQPHEKPLFKDKIRGVRYNVVRRPFSGGKGNISHHSAKTTKTKYTPKETDEHFYERLRADYISTDPGYWFFRVRTEVSAHSLQVFRDTFLDPFLEQVCWWYEQITKRHDAFTMTARGHAYPYPPMHYRTPFGVWSALEEDRSTEYDAYLETGSEAGLRRVESLFPELQQ